MARSRAAADPPRSDKMKKTTYLIFIIFVFLFLIVCLCLSISEIKSLLNSIYDISRTTKPETEKQTFDYFAYIITANLYGIILCALLLGILSGAFLTGIYKRNQNKVDSPNGGAP